MSYMKQLYERLDEIVGDPRVPDSEVRERLKFVHEEVLQSFKNGLKARDKRRTSGRRTRMPKRRAPRFPSGKSRSVNVQAVPAAPPAAYQLIFITYVSTKGLTDARPPDTEGLRGVRDRRVHNRSFASDIEGLAQPALLLTIARKYCGSDFSTLLEESCGKSCFKILQSQRESA